jgi:hypothetical protein
MQSRVAELSVPDRPAARRKRSRRAAYRNARNTPAPGNFRDWRTFVGVAALLMTVSLIASFIPAQRATRVDPLIALRQA